MNYIFLQFAAEETAGHAEEATGIASLGIDPIAFLLQATTFLLLFLILRKFAFGPIVRMLDERRHKIDAGVRLGDQMTVQKQKMDEEIAHALHKARQEADEIIAGGHKEAGKILKEAEDRALRKTDAMIAEAHIKIEDDMKRVRAGLEKEMLSLVARATEAILKEKIDVKRDEKLIADAIKGAR